MKIKEQLIKLIAEYRNAPTDSNTNKVFDLLNQNHLYFDYSYTDNQGSQRTTYSGYKGKGDFHDIAVTSQNYPNPFDLIEVKLYNIDQIVYVSLETLSFDE